MKFYVLILLFKKLLLKVKDDNKDNPSLVFIIKAYNNVLNQLNTFSPNEMVTEKKINAVEFTPKMKVKLIELSLVKIPKSQMEEMESYRKIYILKKELNELLGIGEKKAKELIDQGLKNMKQLHSDKWFSKLNTDTQVILRHDPLRQIPIEDIQKIEHLLIYNSKTTLVGSYRRKKPFIRDIDILFATDEKNRENDVKNYIKYLKKTFGDKIWIYANGSDKISFVLEATKESRYKSDIFISTNDTFYSMLLYSTGSKQFNIKMRAKAKKLGYLLNQSGIFKNGKKINKPSDKEPELFAILEMEYVEPEYRF